MPSKNPKIITVCDKPLWWDDALYSRVRIELDLSDLNHPFQRHTWVKKDGGENVEGWIRSIRPKACEVAAAGYDPKRYGY